MASNSDSGYYPKWMFYAIGIIIIIWFSVMIYTSLVPREPETIKFEVTGIATPLNASTLVQIHYECIQYCQNRANSWSDRSLCFEQCSKLGSETVETKDKRLPLVASGPVLPQDIYAVNWSQNSTGKGWWQEDGCYFDREDCNYHCPDGRSTLMRCM